MCWLDLVWVVLSVMVKLQPRVSPVCGHGCRVRAKAEAVRCFLCKCLERNWCDFLGLADYYHSFLSVVYF